MSARFCRNRMGRGFAGGLPWQAPGEGGRPRVSPEGPWEAGIGQRRDAATALLGRLHSASGSHLPVEDTAPPCAVATRSAGRGTREADAATDRTYE
jgi:hypothetical protein